MPTVSSTAQDSILGVARSDPPLTGVQVVVRAPADAQIAISDESLDLRWWPLDQLPGADFGLEQLARAARP